MSTPYDKDAAVVFLPAVAGGRLTDASLYRWLARADLARATGPEERLHKTLGILNLDCPDDGLGALRMWGQTGERPTVWIAAADPVYLEPRLDHLCLHALADSVPASDLGPLIDGLQQRLATQSGYGFARVGRFSYLRADQPLATSTASPAVVHLQMPNDFLPRGSEADAHRRLSSEVEMALHDHDVNRRRESEGLQPVNALWLWGGGFAPELLTVPHPPLFADDPLLKGHWLSKTAVAEPWPGDIDACLEASLAGFVAVVPEVDDPGVLQRCLEQLRLALRAGRLSGLHLVFRDGVEAHVTAAQRWRVWQSRAQLLDA